MRSEADPARLLVEIGPSPPSLPEIVHVVQSVKILWRVGSERFERSTDSQSYVNSHATEDSMPIDDPKNSSRQSNS